MKTSADSTRPGDAAAAVRYHYDLGNAFFSLWLDRSLTYSCALPAGAHDTLESAQERKLQFHLDAIRADRARSVLDVGCGWGALLQRLAEHHRVDRAVGLTLSEEQAAFVRARAHPGVEVRTESWTEYEPDAPFDGIISVGAFEHFARPDQSADERLAVYRHFFARCHRWLADGGVLSLQTITYSNMSREDASEFIQQSIFPDAELPTFAQIAAAAEGHFEVQSVSNGRMDYAWTCEQWAQRLRMRREEAIDLVGREVVARFERYLKLSALGFRMGKICLLRLVFQPRSRRYFRRGGASAA
jgi:cyclopropane-fatty-acyl-phospholipid synthase